MCFILKFDLILSKVIIFLVICNFWFIKKFGTLFEIWFIASRDYSNKAVYSLILRKVLLLYYFGDFLCNIFGFMEVFFHKTTNSIFWHSYLNCTSKHSILFPFEDLASSKKMIVLVVVWEVAFGENPVLKFNATIILLFFKICVSKRNK